jgi:hypothetical protein
LARLPDGIRDSHASHILIEFKYTESVNEDAWLQTLGYDTFYKRAKHLAATEVQTFLVSAKTPQQDTLTEYGYLETAQKGVYRSQERLLRPITLLLLNQLPPTPQNAFIKCFASRLAEKRKAFAQLRRLFRQPLLSPWTSDLGQLLSGLFKCWFEDTGEEFMKQELNPEQVKQMGREWLKASLAQLSVTERLQGLKPQEVIRQYAPQEVLSQYAPQEVLSQYAPQERLMGLKPQEVLKLYAPQERLMGLEPQEVFAQFDPDKIEEYLNQLKRQKAHAETT